MKKKYKVLGILILSVGAIYYTTSSASLKSNSLLGNDQNSNGVRDDIETYIDGRAEKNSLKHRALTQAARDYQSAFKSLNAPVSFKKACKAAVQSMYCVIAIFGESGMDEVFALEPELFDNFERSRAAVKINAEQLHHLSHSLTALPGVECCESTSPERKGCNE